MPHIEANGIQIYYELHGPEDADMLILSNGVLMSTTSWAYQLRVLSKHYRLLLYDCRGMWQSEHPPGPYSMALHADDLAALMDELGIQAAHIGGASYGAEISMVFALRYPKRTRSLIVISAVSQIDPLLKGMGEMWVAAAVTKDPSLLYRVTYPLNFSEDWIAENQELLDQAQERYKEIDFDPLLELFRSFLRFNITADLHNIQAPTLVAVGEEDILKPRKYAEIIAREIPNSELAIIPHAGHAVMWEQADLVNDLIVGFLTRQGNRKDVSL